MFLPRRDIAFDEILVRAMLYRRQILSREDILSEDLIHVLHTKKLISSTKCHFCVEGGCIREQLQVWLFGYIIHCRLVLLQQVFDLLGEAAFCFHGI